MALSSEHYDFGGQINGGKLELETPVNLPDGTIVRVTITPKSNSLSECLKDYIGAIDDRSIPSDLSSNLDHYMYGSPKE